MTNFNKENKNNNNIYPIYNEQRDIKLSNKELTKLSNEIINIVLHSEDDYEAEYSIIEKIKEIILLNDTNKHIDSLKQLYVLSDEEKQKLQSYNKEEINPIKNVNANTQKP